ncbi:hypothetical protein, partial [Xanthomonas perforans]|uniref:hypothetical protein n=1 Tax=Xanthomonas perforans TaxID=442694 RepID=UPI00115CF3D5
MTRRAAVLKRNDRETRQARKGRPGVIIAKMNSVNDQQGVSPQHVASLAGERCGLLVLGAGVRRCVVRCV